MPKNMANYLTIGRVLMIPVFLVLMYVDFPGSRYWALGVYIVACLTDFADGYIARHYNQISDFGKFMDPLADKCLVMAALCCFVEQGDMLAWILAVVLVREFAVSGMRFEMRQLLAGPLVRQDQDRQHHGVHLPDPVRHSSRAEHRLSSGDPCDHRVLRRGVFHEERRRVQVRRDQVTIQIKKWLCTTVQSRFFHAKMSS